MSFNALEKTIRSVLKDSVFSIPRNQRKYVWGSENWSDLLDDIFFSIIQGKPHFIGSFVVEKDKEEDGLTYYSVIDGQQRLTTIILLIIAIFKIFLENDMNDALKGTIEIIKPKDENNQGHIVLDTEISSAVKRMILAIENNENNDIKNISIDAFIKNYSVNNGINKNANNALKFFYKSIKEFIKESDNPTEKILAIKNKLFEMIVIRIVSDNDEDSYTIFEILNARGQELQNHELLKNHIMRYMNPIDKRDEAKECWRNMEESLGTYFEAFIKHYVTHKWGGSTKGLKFRDIQKKIDKRKMQDILYDIMQKSEYYKKFVYPDSCEGIEKYIFSFFKGKRFEQFRPIILSLMHQVDLENLSREEYENTLWYLYNFFVCYTIIGEEKSNKLTQIIDKYAPMIESDDFNKDDINQLIESIKKKMPDYRSFVNAFKTIGYSKVYQLYSDSRSKNRAKIVLEIFEQYVSQKYEIEEFTIEHLKPDYECIDNSQIGNLIPLESGINEKLKDKSLSLKMDAYRVSNFASARKFLERNTAENFDPNSRTEHLAKLIYKDILKISIETESVREPVVAGS